MKASFTPRRPVRFLRRLLPLLLCFFGSLGVPSSAQGADEELLGQIASLRAEIAHHDDLYFRQAAPEITDYEYDLLKLELRRLEAEAGLPSGSSGTVGDDRAADADLIPHGAPMLSLDKAYSDDEVSAFFEQVSARSPDFPVRFSLEPKFDGVAVNVVLRHGDLVSAATRGNGAAGEDITSQVNTLRGLHYEWAFDTARPRIEQIELRGEIFLTHQAFARLNANRTAAGLEPFSHPRNVAAGSIKLEDLNTVAARGLSLVFHGWGDVEPAAAAPASVRAFQHWLAAQGLPAVADAVFVTPASAAELNAAVAALRGTPLPFPTDGVVIKVDDVGLQQALGHGPTAPRWALARKFAPPRAETVLRNIAWQVGRTGTLTPVAEFDPVELDGARLARASLHQPAAIRRRDLRLGDTIWIERAGEIIPQVAGLVRAKRPADAAPYTLPTACPSCAGALEQDPSDLTLTCPNRDCPAQVVERLLHFASRQAMGIRGLGPSLAEKLVSAGLVQSVPDLFDLESAQLVALPGVGERTAARLLEAIDDCRYAPLDRVLIGLGLPGVGPSGARALADQVDGLDELLQADGLTVTLAVLGPATSGEVRAALEEPAVRRNIRRLAGELQSR